MLRRPITALLPVLLLVACTSASPAASEGDESAAASAPESAAESAAESAGESAAESAAASVGGGGGGLASVDLTITGGEFAGHYEVTITQGGCATGTYGPGSFTVSSVVVDPAGAFDGPQLTIYDSAAAASGTDDQFSSAFPFNQYAYTVEVNPYLSLGTGTATLDDRGDTATVTIEGTSSDGDGVSATIECHSVTSM